MQNIQDPLDIQVVAGAALSLLQSHHGKTIIMTASGPTVTISVGLPKGFWCQIICSGGVFTVAGASGVTASSGNSSLANLLRWIPVTVLWYDNNKYTVNQGAPSIP